MKLRWLTNLVSALTLTSLWAASAQAFSFKTNYNAALTGEDIWKGDIKLESVEFGGKTYKNFGLVNQVNILENDVWTKGNEGAASADYGDLATVGLKKEHLAVGVSEAAKTALGNLYLSSIIDTEDSGSFKMDLLFDKAVDNILVWERGQNSNLKIQALNAKGQLIGNELLLGRSKASNNSLWTDAGYRLNTREISDAQAVSSLGLSLADLGIQSGSIHGLRVISESNYNGPDWKVIGTSVPEPTTLAGLGVVVTSLLVGRRKSKAS